VLWESQFPRTWDNAKYAEFAQQLQTKEISVPSVLRVILCPFPPTPPLPRVAGSHYPLPTIELVGSSP